MNVNPALLLADRIDEAILLAPHTEEDVACGLRVSNLIRRHPDSFAPPALALSSSEGAVQAGFTINPERAQQIVLGLLHGATYAAESSNPRNHALKLASQFLANTRPRVTKEELEQILAQPLGSTLGLAHDPLVRTDTRPPVGQGAYPRSCSFCEYFDGGGEGAVASARQRGVTLAGDCLNASSPRFTTWSDQSCPEFVTDSTLQAPAKVSPETPGGDI